MRKETPLIAAALAMTLLVGCSAPQEPQPAPPRQTLVVYGFSIQEEVIIEEIFPAFQVYWLERTGQEVTLESAFTGSEDLTAEIVGGAEADIAILSNEQHAVWLHINDVVETDWHNFPNEGVVSRSPLVIVVRPGNPLRIRDWADLSEPGVQVIHPDPLTSGGAQWALLAEYGSALLQDDLDKKAADAQLRGIWTNVIATPASSREALREFMFGAGDTIVTYEQDALLAQSRGAEIEVVIPRSTVMSEHVAVVLDRNVKPWEQSTVEAFVSFLWSDEAQRAFTHYYFRAVTNQELNQEQGFHEIEHVFTVKDLGGWGHVYPEIIQGAWKAPVSE
jgi:sulfate/thiosulfate-binding protein